MGGQKGLVTQFVVNGVKPLRLGALTNTPGGPVDDG